MKLNLKAIVWNSLKFVGACAIIVAIAALILVVKDPREPVIAEAEADIFWGVFSPKTNQQRFTNSLLEEGFAKPRSYDWNGNKFFFSMMNTTETPIEVMARLQEGFVRNGINKQAYLAEAPALSGDMVNPGAGEVASLMRNFNQFGEFVTGGIVPVQVKPGYVAMSGTLTKNEASSQTEFMSEVAKAGGLQEAVKAMRYIEAWENKESGLTTVTAAWSDEQLDFSKWHGRGERKDLSVDPGIPACVGCNRTMRFAGEGSESGYVQTVYSGHNTTDSTANFYERALGTRGWKHTGSGEVMSQLREMGVMEDDGVELSTYARGKDFVSVLVYPDQRSGRAITHVFEAP
ncbi:MAG: hypothetical protein H0U74_21540 [Bradymonadaceae bacterium]|nr:hypothetical protein [Lujinxingiaceae bacterium]